VNRSRPPARQTARGAQRNAVLGRHDVPVTVAEDVRGGRQLSNRIVEWTKSAADESHESQAGALHRNGVENGRRIQEIR
jgi:hypothetical protein